LSRTAETADEVDVRDDMLLIGLKGEVEEGA
jgi:hypothetical protein